MADIVHKHDAATIVFSDGTATPLTCTVHLDEGDFAISGVNDNLREEIAYESRGQVQSVKATTRKYPSVTFTCKLSEYTDTTNGTDEDFIFRKAGTPYEDAVTTADGTSGRIYSNLFMFDITHTIDGTALDGGDDRELVLQDCRVTDWSVKQDEPAIRTFTVTVYGNISGDIAISPQA